MSRILQIPTRAMVASVVKSGIEEAFERMLTDHPPPLRAFLGLDPDGNDIYESDEVFRDRIKKELESK